MRNKLVIFILILIPLIFHCFSNYFILSNSRRCLTPDELNYFDRTVRISQALGKFKFNLKLLPAANSEAHKVIFGYRFKPPLFFLTASPFLLFGIDQNNVIMSNLIYFAILLFSTYGIGKKLYDYRVGLLSAFLVSMFPTVFAQSRVFMTDFSLLALVSLTFYLFLLNRFDSFKFSFFTGIVIGLSSLTRQAYLIFLFPILLYFFLQKENLKNKKIIYNFIFSVVLAATIAAVYYARFSFAEQLSFHHCFQCKNMPNPYAPSLVLASLLTIPEPFFYLLSIFNRQLLPVFSLLFLVGLVFSFREKKYLLPIVVFVQLMLLSVFVYKQDRFILPIFPYIAVLISGFIWSLTKFRKTAILVLVLFSFLQYFAISYGSVLPFLNNHYQKLLLDLQKNQVSEAGLFSITDEGYYLSSCQEIMKVINDEFGKSKLDREVNVLLITQDWKIDTTMDYLRITKKLPINLHKSGGLKLFLPLPENIDTDFDQRILQSDFIILEEIQPRKLWFLTEYFCGSFKRNFDKFSLLKSVLFTGNVFVEQQDKPYLAVSARRLSIRPNVFIFKNKSLSN